MRSTLTLFCFRVSLMSVVGGAGAASRYDVLCWKNVPVVDVLLKPNSTICFLVQWYPKRKAYAGLFSIEEVVTTTSRWLNPPEMKVLSVVPSPRFGFPKKTHPTSGAISQALSRSCAQTGPASNPAVTDARSNPLRMIGRRIAPPRTEPVARLSPCRPLNRNLDKDGIPLQKLLPLSSSKWHVWQGPRHGRSGRRGRPEASGRPRPFPRSGQAPRMDGACRAISRNNGLSGRSGRVGGARSPTGSSSRSPWRYAS